MKAFITGSQAYGKPHSNSDIDMVVLVSHEDALILQSMSDDPGLTKITYGKLNLIVLDESVDEDVKNYNGWKTGTEQLKSRKPVTRNEAIELLDTLITRNKNFYS